MRFICEMNRKHDEFEETQAFSGVFRRRLMNSNLFKK